MKQWIRNYGVTFVVEAETEEEAESLLDEMCANEMGSTFLRESWASDVEEHC